jgi:BstXI restriction endonuclease
MAADRDPEGSVYVCRMPPRSKLRLPKLPALVQQKLTKTGYTRGATVGEIYQNRVTRNNPVLIPWELRDQCQSPGDGSGTYEKGFIVLIQPSWYFEVNDADALLATKELSLGKNALLLYQRRSDWDKYRPSDGKLPNGKPFVPANSRSNPLGGVYFARVHATIADEDLQVTEGFNTNRKRGAGIRVYEYASKQTIEQAKVQLEALIWLCYDTDKQMIEASMTAMDVSIRKTHQLKMADTTGLLDYERLRTLRLINHDDHAICPLCLERISASSFMRRTEQAVGRETYDLTTTEISLFHIQELRVGEFQHKPYNLGWGHHHCNVVVKDSGIMPTLNWMKKVLDNQPAINLEAETQLVEEAIDGK